MDEREKKNRRLGQLNKRIVIGLGAVLIICIVAMLIFRFTRDNVDTSAGVKKLKQMDKVKVADIEKKIDALEQKNLQEDEEYQSRPVKEKFQGSVVLGDSITQGLVDYEVLDSSSVIANIGIEITDAGEELAKAEGLNPKNVFLAYGMNDIEAADGNPEVFKEWYKKMLDELKDKLPDAKIYVNSILPVQQKEIDREPNYAHLDEFNKVLEALCEEEKVTFLNNTDLVKEEFYQPDGVHMGVEYYPLWIQKMAEAAKL